MGAYVGIRPLLERMGISLPSVAEVTLTKGEPTPGDLMGMMHLERDKSRSNHWTVSGYNDKETFCYEEREDGYATWYETPDADPRRLMVIRDSFSNALKPIFGSQFAETYLVHQAIYSHQDVMDFAPDVVVLQIVERAFMPVLMNFQPMGGM